MVRLAHYTDDTENAPIAIATRVPPDELESGDDVENAPAAAATRVP